MFGYAKKQGENVREGKRPGENAQGKVSGGKWPSPATAVSCLALATRLWHSLYTNIDQVKITVVNRCG